MAFAIGFTLTFPNGSTRDAVFDSESILIGSGPSTAMRLEDPSVSSIHAVVKLGSDHGVTIIDLGSENGTSVNGQPVSEPIKLSPGDQVRVGSVTLVVNQLGERTAVPKAHVLANEEATVQAQAPGASVPAVVAAKPEALPAFTSAASAVETKRPLTDDLDVHASGTPLVVPASSDSV